MFSKACEYAINIMICIAANEQNNKRTSLKEVTKTIGSPEAFTAKILQQLVKGGLLVSFKGPSGGFVLNQKKDIVLKDIVELIDGDRLDRCVLGFEECSNANPCPVHDRFVSIRANLSKTLLSIAVRDQALINNRNTQKK